MKKEMTNTYEVPVTEVVEAEVLSKIMEGTTGEGGQWGDGDD